MPRNHETKQTSDRNNQSACMPAFGIMQQKTVESWFRTAPGHQKIKTQEIRMRSFKAIVSLSLAVAFSVTATFGQATHYDVAGMDTKTSACTDFYQYANGGWLAANPIPAAYSAWGVANILNEKTRDILREILEEEAKNTAAKKGSNEQKVGDYFASCMDEAKIEAEGLTPI